MQATIEQNLTNYRFFGGVKTEELTILQPQNAIL